MEYLANYLGHHREYQKVLIILGKDVDDFDINQIINTSSFAKLDIYCLRKLDLPNVDYLHQIDTISDRYDLAALINYRFDESFIVFKDINSKDVLLLYKEGLMDVLSTWEYLRERYENIHFVTMYQYRNEVLDYHKENNVELSVIFPVYNVSKYLNQCIESVTKWDAPYIEYLFIDDGSKDDSASIIKEAMKIDKRVKLISKENGGCASAREKGLEVAQGRYVGFIDPDDFIDPSMFKKLLSRALMGNYDIAWCGYNEYLNTTGKATRVEDLNGFPYNVGIRDKNIINDLICYRRIAIWRAIYRRKFLIDNNIHFHTDIKRFDDLPFKVETMALATSVVSIDEYLYYYRLEREGQDTLVNDERLFVHFDIFRHLDEFFKDKDDKQKARYEIVKRDTHNWALSVIRKDLKKKYKKLMKGISGEKVSLTIAVPFYNASRYITNFLSSMDGTTHKKVHFIFVNDGSNDDSLEILKRYTKNRKNIKIISTKHCGVSHARNLALRKTKTKYIWFADIDDNLTSENILEAFKVINDKVHFDLYCFANQIRNGSALSFVNAIPNKGNNSIEYGLQVIADYPYLWNKIFSLRFLDKNKIRFANDVVIGEDALFVFESIIQNPTIFITNTPVYTYVINSNSSINSINKASYKLFDEHMKMVNYILNLLNQNQINDNKKYIEDYFELLISNSVDESMIPDALERYRNSAKPLIDGKERKLVK